MPATTVKETKDPARIRILSIDGGGIYGLTSAIWLRQLCEGNPHFLDGTDVDLFAGCSSGAINALMLARHERPRDAVLAGELEQFWMGAGPFANSHPMLTRLSRRGFAGWFSDFDFLDALKAQFGRMHLSELAHFVHISAFNWTGAPGLPTVSRAAQGGRHWRPKFFNNIFIDDEDHDYPAVKVAYVAAAPPMFRPMRNGLGDGASFTGNPIVSAIAQVVRTHYVHKEDGDVVIRRQQAEVASEPHKALEIGAILDRIALISLGSGQTHPYYAFSDVNFGAAFSLLPSNPFTGVPWPPMVYSVDPATEEAEYIAKALVGRHRALRLNPGVINVPTIVASLWARNPLLRKLLIQRIYQATSGPESLRAIRGTLAFMASHEGWNRGVPPASSAGP